MKKELVETLEIPFANPTQQEISGRKQNAKNLQAAQSKTNILDLIAWETQEPRKLHGVVIGKLINFDDVGNPLVDFSVNPSETPVAARSTLTLDKIAIGQEVVLMFEEGNPYKPIVMGLIQHPRESTVLTAEKNLVEQRSPLEAKIDGERLVFTAQKEIVLRCGNASITLTRAGKVLISGTYLLNRSSGVNRIKGGSVQIN
jgi:hypothetical protein